MDRSALTGHCEPLLAVAEAHAEGKEAFARSIATELFSDFLSVEERFAANKEATEQEVIDQLRQVRSQMYPARAQSHYFLIACPSCFAISSVLQPCSLLARLLKLGGGTVFLKCMSSALLWLCPLQE